MMNAVTDACARTILSVCCAIFSMIATSIARGESLEDLRGVVLVNQTRSFSDSEQLSASVQVAPPAIVINPKGSSPSELIQRTFGFGASDSKPAYDVLEKRVLELNGVEDPKSFPAGKVLVPDLPKLTSQEPSPELKRAAPTARNNSPVKSAEELALSPSPPPVVPAETLAYSRPISISPPVTGSIIFNRVDIYPAVEALRIAKTARSLNIPAFSGMEAGIQLADSAMSCNEPVVNVLGSNERALIRKSLQEARPKGERFLVILDTGWPTLEDQTSSLQQLRRIFDEVRKAIRIPPGSLRSFQPTVDSTKYIPPTHNHTCLVRRSLQEFRQLDPNNLLKVIFVPLRPGQPRSIDVFREIIQIDNLITNLGYELSGRTPSKAELEAAIQFSDAVLSLPALRNPWLANDDVVKVYEPLISGLIRVLDIYARIDPVAVPGHPEVDAKFWISVSWNFTKYVAAPDLPSSGNYMVFVAAGNDNTDFVRAQRLYVSEVMNNRRVVAVMNSDEKSGAATCGTATFDGVWKAQNEDAPIVSFPGRLSNATDAPCPGEGGGTSFSAPRLAWLAGISEIVNSLDKRTWIRDMAKRLVLSRSKSAADPNSAPVVLDKLFAGK